MSTPEAGQTKWLNVTVYLGQSLAARLRAQRKRSRLPYAAVLAAAFTTVDEEQVRQQWAPEAAVVAGSGMPASPTWSRTEDNQQIQLRMTVEQRQWLDDQVQRFGAPSRSALVGAVLNAGLPLSLDLSR